MSGMDDLITWLRAQLDEDERVAKAAPGPKWVHSIERGGEPGRWTGKAADLASLPPEPPLLDWQAGDEVLRAAPNNGAIDHAIRWDPARVLAKVDADRRIVDWLAEIAVIADAVEVYSVDVNDALCLLALPYADQPGYRDEWKPVRRHR